MSAPYSTILGMRNRIQSSLSKKKRKSSAKPRRSRKFVDHRQMDLFDYMNGMSA